MNTAAWQPLRTALEPVNASLKTEDKGARSGNDIGYGRFRACSETAPGACFRRKQHLGAGGDHGPGAVRSPHRGLRSQSLLPRELLPTHEQGFLFARARQRLEGRVGLALPSFASYRTVHSKAGFSRLLDRLGLPQPATAIVKSERELRDAIRFPCLVKTSVGTASRGIWLVRDDNDLEGVLQDLNTQGLSANGAFADEVLVQDLIAGTTEKAQSVFCRGQLIGIHAYRQMAAGAGGGEAIKQSVSRPHVRAHLATIGQELAWHGALSV